MKIDKFKYLITAVLPMTTLAGPVHAQQTTAPAIVSTKTTPVDGDDETNHPNAYQLFGHGDPKLDSLNKQVDHYSKLMYNYDHSKTYETLNAKAKGFSGAATTFYDNDTLRNIMAGITKISKGFNASESRSLELEKDSLGHLVGDYFKTEKFREFNSKLQKKYRIDPAKKYSLDNADYTQYHDELFKKMPQEIKNDLQQLKDLSAKFRNMLQTPEFVADIKQLRILIDSMKNYYKKPHTAQYTYASYEATMDIPAEERRKAQNELYNYMERPEFHQYSEMLNGYAKQMRDYFQNSPTVKAHEEAWKNELRAILADDYDIILHPGRGLEHLYSN
jgi:hypothetical protein